MSGMLSQSNSTRTSPIRMAIGLLLLLALVPAPGDSQDAEFTLNVNVDLVELNVIVIDEAGHHVTTLAKDDFRILEDSVPQETVLFRQDDMPVSLGLVIDNSRSMERKKPRVDHATLSFIGYSNPEDETFLIHFDDTARLALDFTSDLGAIGRTLTSIEPYGQTALFDAVRLGLDTMEKSRHDQKAILVVSDGADNASREGFEQILQRVRESDVIVYTIGLLRDPVAESDARTALQALADAGGGRAFFPSDEGAVSSLTERIAFELRDLYRATPSATEPGDRSGWRSPRPRVGASI
jgi:Ca-activated chloride channel family protein